MNETNKITADEMFEKMGYEKTHDNQNYIVYSKRVELCIIRICINRWCNCVSKYSKIGRSGGVDTYLEMYWDEIQAINKKFEEMGVIKCE